MARFSNAAQWDPGVTEATEAEPGEPGLGSTYRLVVPVFGRAVLLGYRVEDFDRPNRVVLSAENSMVRSTDVIEVFPEPRGGTVLTFDATLRFKGGAVLFTPLLGLSLRHIGNRAIVGLRSALADLNVDVRGARHALALATDTVAEATVAPGFSRVGIGLRRRLEEWDDPPRMKGRVTLVTGATSGIGLAAATALAGLGADVHLVGRDPDPRRHRVRSSAGESPGPNPTPPGRPLGSHGRGRILEGPRQRVRRASTPWCTMPGRSPPPTRPPPTGWSARSPPTSSAPTC